MKCVQDYLAGDYKSALESAKSFSYFQVFDGAVALGKPILDSAYIANQLKPQGSEPPKIKLHLCYDNGEAGEHLMNRSDLAEYFTLLEQDKTLNWGHIKQIIIKPLWTQP